MVKSLNSRGTFFLIRIACMVCISILLAGCNQGQSSATTPSQLGSTQAMPSTAVTPNVTGESVGSPSPGNGFTPSPENPPTPPTGITQFGLLTVIPGTTGATYSEQILASANSVGVRFVRVALDWGVSEPQAGQITFDSHNDEMIQGIEDAGMRVFPTLYVGSGWMNGSPSNRQSGGSRSYPPDDLSSQWNDQFGYSQNYYNFVYTFIQHYQGHFDYVAIENEAESKLFWGGTEQDYLRLLKTAYKAIKAADPQVQVVNSGFVSSALGLCIAGDRLDKGSETPDEIMKFVTDYYQYVTNRSQVATINQLQKVLKQNKLHDQCQRIYDMLDNMGGMVDAVNFHFYEDYSVLPGVVDWLRQRTSDAGYTPEIVSNEMGIRNRSSDFAASADHAQAVEKDMITAMSLGLRAVVWFSADTVQAGKDKVGLFDENGQMRLAGKAMNSVIRALPEGDSLAGVESTDPGTHHFVVKDSNGVTSMDILWCEGAQTSLMLQGPPGSTEATVTDFNSAGSTISAVNGSISLTVGAAPLFVLWK